MIGLTPEQFVQRWQHTALGERQSYQLHFVDVCQLVGHAPPTADGIDAHGQRFAFEYGVKKDAGGQGFADVFYEGHFAVEYKAAGKYKELNEAYQQLLQYREKLLNPPLLVVTDIHTWEIHTNWPNTEKKVYRFSHADIASRPSVLRLLHDLFHAPERLHPDRNAEQVTTDAAEVFHTIAEDMRNERAADAQRIAHFLTKLVFCLFAEDVNLLPNAPNSSKGIFTEIIDQTRREPSRFRRYAGELFQAMADGGDVLFQRIPYFNGSLFDDVSVEDLSVEALGKLEQASKLNWESVEPAIFGTLFERSLDPAKRAQLGAHYTSRDDILLIVEPVLMAPLRREWEAIQAEAAPIRAKLDAATTPRDRVTYTNALTALRERMLKRLREIRVLDPACGSGNFLYVALQRLMDLEKEVIYHELFHGLTLPMPEVHPRQMFGIEKDPIAHDLASIVVWIGYIQWRQQNGYATLTRREPILEALSGNIRLMDAIISFQHPEEFQTPPLTPPQRFGEGQGEGVTFARLGEGQELKSGWAHTHTPPEIYEKIKLLAREMRNEPTPAEKELWQRLRHKQIGGYKFRRQHAIDRFIVDFYCAEARLVVEVDGSIHDYTQEEDAARQAFLESLGLRVIRFRNEDVFQNIDGVVERIGEVLQDPAPNPSPTPWASDPTPNPSPTPWGGAGGGVSEPDWPEVDVIVGNPPFLGGNKIRQELGDDYVDALFRLYEGRVPAFADLVCYWYEKARAHIEAGKAKRAGLLATNSIRGGANRRVLERIKETGDIFMAWSDREWILDGAAVRVSMVGFEGQPPRTGSLPSPSQWVSDPTPNPSPTPWASDPTPNPSPTPWGGAGGGVKTLDGLPVSTINADLTASVDITQAKPLKENEGLGFRGNQKGGAFDIDAATAQKMLEAVNASGRSNRDVVKPWWNGLDITGRPRNMWLIDFGTNMPLEEAYLYEMPLAHVQKYVKPERDTNNRRAYRDRWWIHNEARPSMRAALAPLSRFLVTPHVSKHRLFVWLDKDILPDHQLIVIARSDDYFFGVLHSRIHEVWSLRMGTSLEDRPRYTPTTTFETFPFPWPPGREDTASPAYQAISAAARQLHEERHAWLNPALQTDSSDAVGARHVLPLPQPDKHLKDRTLTNLYNALNVWRGVEKIRVTDAAAEFAPRLDALHTALDRAVCAAYGWPESILADDEAILRRVLALNLERARPSDAPSP